MSNDNVKSIAKTQWAKWNVFAPSTKITGVVKIDEEGNLWEWVASGLKVTVRRASVDRIPPSAPVTKASALRALHDTFPDSLMRKIAEYVEEGEHQDGSAYWENFPGGVSEVIADFRRYINESHSAGEALEPFVAVFSRGELLEMLLEMDKVGAVESSRTLLLSGKLVATDGKLMLSANKRKVSVA